MLVELHTHNYYSRQEKVLFDGIESPENMVRHAARIGIGAMAITDHNTMQGYEEIKHLGKELGILLIPGEEITSAQGHIVALGIQEPIASGHSVLETVDLIHAQGGVAIASHPFDVANEGLREYAIHCDAIEIFSAINVDRISNLVAKQFAKKHHMVGVASSDAHFSAMLGHGANTIDATDVDGIVKAVKQGQIGFPSSNSYMPVDVMTYWGIERLKKSYDYTLDYIENNYSWPKRVVSKRMLNLVTRSPGHIDKVFKCVGYVSLGGVVAASVSRNVV